MYDLIIIGGGPAGYSAAFRATGYGLKTVLFEEKKLGGTCLNRGCIPTKYMSHAANIFSSAHIMQKCGIFAENMRLDENILFSEKEKITAQLGKQLEGQLSASGIEIINSHVTVNGIGSVTADGNEYKGTNILIAAGSVPDAVLTDGSVTSDGLLELKKIPRNIGIMGGGVVAAEFAQIYRGFGAEVTIMIRGDRILRKWDKDISSGLAAIFKKQGIRILTNITENAVPDAEIILSANGRKPALDKLFASSDVPDMNEDGIIVDERCQTSVRGIYAAGDIVSGSRMLAHTAMEQGRRAVDCMMCRNTELHIPKAAECIYTSPEIACVGLTEQQAVEIGIDAVTVRQPMYSNARSMISCAERSFVKLIADRKTKKLIGAHLMCERASDIISELTLAVNADMTVEEISENVRPHPSYCEAVSDAVFALLRKMS